MNPLQRKAVELYADMENGRLRVFAKLRGPVLMNVSDVANDDVTDSFVRLAATVGPTLLLAHDEAAA